MGCHYTVKSNTAAGAGGAVRFLLLFGLLGGGFLAGCAELGLDFGSSDEDERKELARRKAALAQGADPIEAFRVSPGKTYWRAFMLWEAEHHEFEDEFARNILAQRDACKRLLGRLAVMKTFLPLSQAEKLEGYMQQYRELLQAAELHRTSGASVRHLERLGKVINREFDPDEVTLLHPDLGELTQEDREELEQEFREFEERTLEESLAERVGPAESKEAFLNRYSVHFEAWLGAHEAIATELQQGRRDLKQPYSILRAALEALIGQLPEKPFGERLNVYRQEYEEFFRELKEGADRESLLTRLQLYRREIFQYFHPRVMEALLGGYTPPPEARDASEEQAGGQARGD